MVTVTELNRAPNITVNARDAASVSADALEAGVSITDPANNTITDFVGGDLTLDNGTLKAITSPDVRTSLNDLFVRNAEQDFELGLTQLNYRDGQFEIYADDSKVASITDLNLVLGSPLNNAGFAELVPPSVGSISTLVDSFTGHGSNVEAVSGSGDFGYSADGGGETVKKWDVDTMSEQDEFTGHTNYVPSVFVVDTYGYSASFSTTVKKWDVDTMSEQDEFTGHTDEVYIVFVAGSYGYSGGKQGELRKWDVDTMSQQAEFTGHSGTTVVRSIAVGDGNGYSGADTATVKKWDTDTMSEQDEFTGHSGNIYSISLDGSLGYSASDDGTVKKWDVDTMSQQDEFTGHSDSVYGVFILRDFGYSVSQDNTIRKWDTDTMTEQSKYDGGFDPWNGVYADSGYVYAGGDDQTVSKFGEASGATTSGNVQHTQQDVGFVPNTAVVSDDLRQLPTDTDVYYEIADDAGNTVTIQRSDIDGEVDLSALNSSVVSTTAYLERPGTDTPSPQLNAWALYLNE